MFQTKETGPAGENGHVVRRLIEDVANGGEMMRIDDLVACDYVDHAGPPGRPSDREALKQMLSYARWMAPHFNYRIQALRTREDTVVTGIVLERDGLLSSPETHIFRIAGGRISEHWGDHGLFSQLHESMLGEHRNP